MAKRSKRAACKVLCLGVWAATVLVARGQTPVKPLGTVSTTDARVSGQVEVRGGQAQLLSNVSVTAYDRTAPVTLDRGGQVQVCSTSEFHLLRAGGHGSGGATTSLLFGLDRGALELRSPTQSGDIIITPDLKLTPVTQGSYDLRLRVTREGDTCIENLGVAAPVLNVTDAFTSNSYRVLPRQHLLFVKGDLHRVIDGERSPCGCPAAAPMVAGATGTAAATHPFPQAESEGLAATTMPSNAAPAGEASSQATASFSYGEGAAPAPGSAVTPVPGSAAAPATPGLAAPPAPDPAQKPGFFHAIGRFFKRIFR